MLKPIIFPYGIALKENGLVEVFPAADILFKNRQGKWISLFLIIDSGATVSALPKSDGLLLGVEVEKGRRMNISGLSEQSLYGWQHLLSIRIGEEEIRAPFVFLESEAAPRVLGRAGLFEHFIIVFEELKQRSGFIKEGTKPSELIRDIFKKGR